MQRRARLRFFVAALAATLPGCADSDDAEVAIDEIAIHGSGAILTQPGEYPAVGKVLPARCTGTLIADDLVLTAAHCVCSNNPYVCNNGPTDFVLTGIHRVAQPDVVQDSLPITGDPIAHPDFGIGTWPSQDLAVIKLRQPVSATVLDAPPMPLVPVAPSEGWGVTMVGYGGGGGAICDGSFGTKRHAFSSIDDISGGGWVGAEIRVEDDHRQACPGDSGGPLIDGNGQVIGVASAIYGSDGTQYESTHHSREWIEQQFKSPGNRFQLWSFDAGMPARTAYIDKDSEPNMIGFSDADDFQFVGDFMATGYDQVLVINRGAGDGRVRIADLADGVSMAEQHYYATKTQASVLNGFIDATDRHFVGDFMDVGHDQLLAINRSGSGGRIRIFDFADGALPIDTPYLQSYGTSSVLFNGWHDSNDTAIAGDFRGWGHDQVLFINRSGTGGRVMIADFSKGVPASAVYWESYGDFIHLSGWHDVGDGLVAGDFRALGYDQLMLINRSGVDGRILIVNFSSGVGPAAWEHIESYGQSSLFEGWDESSDALHAGDFLGEGFDQLLTVNTTAAPWNGPQRLMLTDFRDGWAPAEVRFLQFQGADAMIEGRIDPDDRIHVGRLRGSATQLLTVERYQ